MSSPLDRSRSPYAESYPDYPERCHQLASLVGCDSFLWCYPLRREELVRKTVFGFISPTEAHVVSVEDFQAGTLESSQD
jgi:hypothetical protein